MATPALPPNIPKRGLSFEEAAEYVGISEELLREAVQTGAIHPPRPFGRRRKVFDRVRLDADLDKLFGVEANDTIIHSTTLRERLHERKAAVRRSQA